MSVIYANPIVVSASAAFRAVVKTVYGDTIQEGQEQSTLESFGVIVSHLINTVGPASAKFKEADAKYMQIVPAWTAFVNARNAAK